MNPLVDIGNTQAHIFYDGSVYNLPYELFFKKFQNQKLYYINVNPQLEARLKKNPLWVDLKSFVHLPGAYDTMGIDRQVLLLSRGDGIYIDAGSAITIDKLENNRFQGGTILPGVWSVLKCYKEISPVLALETIQKVNLERVPKSNTQNTISYGIIAPIIALIEKINTSQLPIYCCGGDGELFVEYLENAHYSKELIFEGIQKVLKEYKC